MDVDGARVAGERVAPDPLEQLVAGQDEAAVVEQLPEEVELLRRELDLLAADASPRGGRRRCGGRRASITSVSSSRRSGEARRRIDLIRATSSRGLKGFVR